MAGRPPTDPDLVAEALRRVAAGEHRDDVAAALAAEGRPISVATIRRAQAAQKPAPAAAAPAPVAKAKPAQARPIAQKRAPAAAKAPPPSALPSPPAPIPLLPDTLDELKAAVEQTKGQLFSLAGRQGYSAAGNLYDKLLKTMAAVERERRLPGTEVAHLLAAGPRAIAKIRQGRAVLAARELETRCCAACGGGLGEEQLAERRARTGT